MVSERVGVRAGRGDVVWKADCGECSQIQRQLGRPMLSTSPCWLWRCRVVFQGSILLHIALVRRDVVFPALSFPSWGPLFRAILPPRRATVHIRMRRLERSTSLGFWCPWWTAGAFSGRTRRAGRGWMVGEPSADDGGVERRGRSLRAPEAGVAARRGAGYVEGEWRVEGWVRTRLFIIRDVITLTRSIWL
jgi:hypothetical protein